LYKERFVVQLSHINPDYPDAYSGFNALASYGSILSALSGVLFFYIVYVSLVYGEPVPKKNFWKKN